jgi:hypothetical protein
MGCSPTGPGYALISRVAPILPGMVLSCAWKMSSTGSDDVNQTFGIANDDLGFIAAIGFRGKTSMSNLHYYSDGTPHVSSFVPSSDYMPIKFVVDETGIKGYIDVGAGYENILGSDSYLSTNTGTYFIAYSSYVGLGIWDEILLETPEPPAPIPMFMTLENSDGTIIYDLDEYFKNLSRAKRGQVITDSIYLHNIQKACTGVKASCVAHPTEQIGRPEDTYLAMTLSLDEGGDYFTELDIGEMDADEKVQIYVRWAVPTSALTGNIKCAIHAEGRCII